MLFRRKKKTELTTRTTRDPIPRSAPVFSYYSSRSNQDNPRQVRTSPNEQDRSTRKPRWLGYLPSLLSLAVILISALYLTTLSTKPRIEISTADNRPAVIQKVDVYEQAAQILLTKSLFNRSKLTINTDKVAQELQAQFPELGDIVVTVPLISRRPIINVSPATPAFIVSGQNGTFVIDKLGRPVLKASQLISSVRDTLPVVSDDSGTHIELGKQLLTTDLVEFIGQLDAQFKAKSVPIESYSLPTVANEVHVKLKGQGYYVKFNTESDARVQIGTYLAVSEKLQADGITPAEYIDVRVEERAFYK